MKKSLILVVILLAAVQLACSAFTDFVSGTPTSPSAGSNAMATMNAASTELAANVPTPVPTEVGLFFEDDFTTADPDWYRVSTDTVNIGFFQSAYRMGIYESETVYWSSIGPRVGDVRVEVDVEQLSGDKTSQVGLLCRFSSDTNFYVATINAEGSYSIFKLQANQWEALRYGQIDLPVSGISPAHLTLDCIGETLAFFLNEELIAMAYDSSFSQGRAGLYVDTYIAEEGAFLFDNFVMHEPPASSPANTGEGAHVSEEIVAADLALAGYEPDQGDLVWSSRNEYEISLSGEHYYMTWQGLDNGIEHSDFILTYDVAWETTTGLAGCGAVLRAGDDITVDAQIRMETWRYSGLPSWVLEYDKFNQRQGFISGEIRSSAAIRQANGSTNHFVIVVDGLTFTVYVNGQRLGVGTGPEALTSGQLAVYTWQESGSSTCTFSNIWIWDILK